MFVARHKGEKCEKKKVWSSSKFIEQFDTGELLPLCPLASSHAHIRLADSKKKYRSNIIQVNIVKYITCKKGPIVLT